MPPGRPPSLSRSLLRTLRIDAVRDIVDHYGLPRARSIEEMIDSIVRKVGADLADLVSAAGPFTLDTWNDLAHELGGQARRSFDSIRDEFAHRLDRVVVEFDMDERISELREDRAAITRLAQLLGIHRDMLDERLQQTHGRTLLGRFVADLRAQAPSARGLGPPPTSELAREEPAVTAALAAAELSSSGRASSISRAEFFTLTGVLDSLFADQKDRIHALAGELGIEPPRKNASVRAVAEQVSRSGALGANAAEKTVALLRRLARGEQLRFIDLAASQAMTDLDRALETMSDEVLDDRLFQWEVSYQLRDLSGGLSSDEVSDLASDLAKAAYGGGDRDARRSRLRDVVDQDRWSHCFRLIKTSLDEAGNGDADNNDEREGGAPATLARLLKDSLELFQSDKAWPALGALRVGDQSFEVSVYARLVGGSARGNPLERRFQNPSQQSEIVDDPKRYELLLGLWVEQGEERAVVVAFDAYRRIGRSTRFSMFMPLALLEQAADTGFATHENNKHETIYAFRPENIGRYVQLMIERGLWLLEQQVQQPAPKAAAKSKPKPIVERLARDSGTESLYIRPRVGMYAAFARLNYKPWFALAEFVDNSIQSFLTQRGRLEEIGHAGPMVIDVNLDDNEISVTDRAAGIAWKDFPRAFSPAAPPDDASGLSEFGLGMKAAACWFARRWTVRTSALGEDVERTVTFDIPKISKEGIENLPIEARPARESDHYTVITMSDLRARPRGRTLTKIKDHLASIYRVLTHEGVVKVRFTSAGKTEELAYEHPALLEAPYYKNRGGPAVLWRKEFEVSFDGRKVRGWAGIMRKGSHAQAGFSVFRRRRLIEGSIGETYKPHTIFGNPNSFAYQRVVGEIFVEGFDVSHTKDGIQWHSYEDEIMDVIRSQLETSAMPLLEQANGYRARKTADVLPQAFGTDALTETANAFEQAAEQVVVSAAAVAAVDDSAPETPASVFQQREFAISVVRDGKPWNIRLELVQDSAAPFYSTSMVAKDGHEVLTVQLNLNHEFSIAFINDNEEVLGPIMRIIAAFALGERLAREAGLKNPGVIRQNANNVLSAIATSGAS